MEISFYTCEHKIMITFYTVPEIWHMTDVIVIFHFGYFLLFYPLNSPKNQNFLKNEKNNWRCFTQVYEKLWYAILFLRYDAWQICSCFVLFFFHVGLFFAILLPPLTAQKIKIQKNIKKSMEIPSFYTGVPKIMIIYYTVPETVHDKCNNYFPFWAIFFLFTHLTAQQFFLKKWQKYLEISSFYTSVPKIMIICYTVPEIWCVTDVIVILHFGLFFAHLPC